MSIHTKITVGYATTCVRCDRKIEVGEKAWWRAAASRGRGPRVTCETCYRGEPGRTRFPFEATIKGTAETYRILVHADGIERVA